MKNQLAQINILGFPPNVITKIFTLLDDKYLLRLREVCHAAKDKVDTLLLIVRKLTADLEFYYRKELENEHDVLIEFPTYFDVIGNRSYTFLRIAMNKIRTEIPILTIKPHKDRILDLRFTLKLEDFSTFLDLLGPRIAGVQWRGFCLYSAPSAVIQSCAKVFNGKHVSSIHAMPLMVENSDYSPWLTLIRNVTASKFSCSLSVVTKDDYKFLIELSENVYSARLLFGDTQKSLVSIAKDMLTRKCVNLDFSHNIITHSELESLLTFLHRLEKKISFEAFTKVDPLDVNIGDYNMDVYEWIPTSSEGVRTVIIQPIEDREEE